ncbi:MAG: YggS family pyridoxal phosphate-dependent enzyme [SAR324 cluster bacterium]|nr:YggS family pyridoxal phosphate-dependent enzyme [SAR324 cluster bacterium]
MHTQQQIQNNLTILQENIAQSLNKSGRTSEQLRLVAVSKTHPISSIENAVSSGLLIFGENRMQEALTKIPLLPDSLEWHFIGHLQKNKVRYCPSSFQWIHSIDSSELVQLLEKRCANTQQPLKALIQVNLSQESTKGGVWEWEELCRVAETLLSCQWLQWKGLMTIAAPQAGETKIRHTFATLYQWKEKLVQEFGNQEECTELSMGMSSDYGWAIEEGATLIRIGSAIFGERC